MGRIIMKAKNVAAIDLGTNSCRLLIADPKGDYLYRKSISTKLGKDMSKNNSFTDEAIKRGVEALSCYSQIMKEYDAQEYRAIATAACRTAQNGKEFLDIVKKTTGIELEVIDGFEEARLNLQGALLNADKEKADYVIVYDIGGGSTEITLATREDNSKIIHSVSIPFGGRNSAEYFDFVEYNQNTSNKLGQEISKYTQAFIRDANLEQLRDNICFMSTSSTPLRLAHIAKDAKEYNRQDADGKKLSVLEFDKAIAKVRSMSYKEMADNNLIGEGRAGIFNPACTIFSQIYQDLGAKEIIVSLKSAMDKMVIELNNNRKSYAS